MALITLDREPRRERTSMGCPRRAKKKHQSHQKERWKILSRTMATETPSRQKRAVFERVKGGDTIKVREKIQKKIQEAN